MVNVVLFIRNILNKSCYFGVRFPIERFFIKCLRLHSAKLRPEKVLRTSPKDVLWMSPYGPLCNANGRPLPTSLGRWSMTSWGRPHTALYVTPLEVPYRHLEGVSCRRYEDVPYSLIYNSKRHVLRTSRGSPSETSWGSPKDALMWFYKQGWETSKR